MKARISKREEIFKPFDVIITVESADDIIDLWFRLGCSFRSAYNDLDIYHTDFPFKPTSKSYSAWEIVNNECKKLKLRVER